MTTIHDLSGPALALLSEARSSGDPAGYLRTADDWLPEDRRRVAEMLGVMSTLTLSGDDLVRLRVGDVRRVEASDGTPFLVVPEKSQVRDELTWPHRVVLTDGELDLIETDPRAGQIVTVEGQPDVLLHVVGEVR